MIKKKNQNFPSITSPETEELKDVVRPRSFPSLLWSLSVGFLRWSASRRQQWFRGMSWRQNILKRREFFLPCGFFSGKRKLSLDCSPTYLPSYFINLNLVICPFLNQSLLGVGVVEGDVPLTDQVLGLEVGSSFLEGQAWWGKGWYLNKIRALLGREKGW